MAEGIFEIRSSMGVNIPPPLRNLAHNDAKVKFAKKINLQVTEIVIFSDSKM